jgi:hypothetical protein
VHYQPAVDGDGLTGDEIGVARGEEGDDAGDV